MLLHRHGGAERLGSRLRAEQSWLHTARAPGFDTEPEGRCESTKGRIEAPAELSGSTLSACPELGCGSREGGMGCKGAPGLSGALLAKVTRNPELWQHGMSVWAGKWSCKPCWSSNAVPALLTGACSFKPSPG